MKIAQRITFGTICALIVLVGVTTKAQEPGPPIVIPADNPSCGAPSCYSCHTSCP